MTEEEVVNKLKQKISENNFYGTMEEKPPTEQELFALQTKLFIERDIYNQKYEEYKEELKNAYAEHRQPRMKKPENCAIKVWSDMLAIMYQYTRSCILKRNKKKKFMEPEDVSDKAIAAALAFMSQYNKNPDFYVGASFAGMVKWKIVEAIYKPKLQAENNHISLNQLISDDGTKEIGDTITYEDNIICGSNDYITVEDKLTSESNENIIIEILHELDEVIGHDSKNAFLTRLYLLIFLRGPKTRHSKRLFMERWAKEHQVEQLLESSILELHQRLIENSWS